VLAENSAMLALARKLGFREELDPEQHGVLRVELALV
jgi:RimJ/RimL family protein N-acetyltransferase